MAEKPRYTARSVEHIHAPALRIVWEKPLDLAPFEIPKDARVFAREKMAACAADRGLPGAGRARCCGLRRRRGCTGMTGFLISRRRWRIWVSKRRFVRGGCRRSSMRRTGLGSTLNISPRAGEPRGDPARCTSCGRGITGNLDAASDEYLRRLIDECHRQAIGVYAWVELPHVSERFWTDHPEWREKTALLQDAQLDWRKLMNLTNRDSFGTVAAGLRGLLGRFDWDGVNLAELYFESLEGFENPARLTPMNDDVRAAFRAAEGYDPAELFEMRSAHHYAKDSKGLGKFLEFRAELVRRQQAEWIEVIDAYRKTAPQLDLVLTHVDDRFDTTMREKIGTDASRVLPMLSDHDFTFLIEDPATVWNLGPQRYPQIAARYNALTRAQSKLAIDIHIWRSTGAIRKCIRPNNRLGSNCLNWSTRRRRRFRGWRWILRTRFHGLTGRCFLRRHPRS